jgi:RimJ/RimL family protein N-acetyltransferase
MSANLGIRRLRPEDASALAALRREALESSPLAFASTPDSPRGSAEFLRGALAENEDQAVFGGFDGSRLVGMVGVQREAGVKQRHKATLWGMFVAQQARQKGVGRALLEAAIEHAGTWLGVSQLHLGVSDVAVAARKLYETAGFRVWGREPRALHWEGRFVDELHLVLELGKP